tara:strand:+ start:192 stop:443 length:252 start_codon:yes stop_codon:yes gene_type:complete
MQPWERIERKLNEIEEKIEDIRKDVNSWRPAEWESYYENDPFAKTKTDKEKEREYNLAEHRYEAMRAQLDLTGNVDLDYWYGS